jgi:hypothetical protein
MKITIETIPYACMRYPTVGDYQEFDDGSIGILIAEMDDWKMQFLIAIHEMIEVILCKVRGITFESIDSWDLNYKGPCDEPGNDPDCPYHSEHIFATGVEKTLAVQLGVDWEEYEKAIENLDTFSAKSESK